MRDYDVAAETEKSRRESKSKTSRTTWCILGTTVILATIVLTLWAARNGAFGDTSDTVTMSGPIMRFQGYICAVLAAILVGFAFLAKGLWPSRPKRPSKTSKG